MANKATKNQVANLQDLNPKIIDNMSTKFTLYNLLGQEKAYYLVDKVNLEKECGKSFSKSVSHSIIVIDRSGSMCNDIEDLKATLIKLLTLDEYLNFQLVISLISYSSKGDVTCHFQRVAIQEVMKKNSPYLQEIQKITTNCYTCISQALEMAKSLVKKDELTAITLHSDGYANDISPSAEALALDNICQQLQGMNVFVNTIAYSSSSDFKLLAKIANTVSGSCIKADNIKEVYNAIYNTSKLLSGNVQSVIEEALGIDYSYQVFLSGQAKKINGASGTLKLVGLSSEDEGVVYKYKPVSQDIYFNSNIPVAQNHDSVYAFAKANLSEGNLNTAKYALASTFNGTLLSKHGKALTNSQISEMAQDIDRVLFNPDELKKHQILNQVPVNEGISLLELIKIFDEHRHSIIINIQHLQENYQRRGIKRVPGVRDGSGNLVKPWLKTEYVENAGYVTMGSFDINRNTATINMLVTRKVKLLKTEDKTPVVEIAGLLLNDLSAYNNYTIVSDGEINIKELRIKISNKKAFNALKAVGVIEAESYDFRHEYTIKLDNLPLVSLSTNYTSIDGLFSELAAIKVLSSIISAHIKEESDVFLPEQLEELKKHYLSKNLYVNFPTTNAYSDIEEAIANGSIDCRTSYKIDIGSKDILNLSKLHSANKFLDRMYQLYDVVTGEIFEKPTFELAFQENIAYRHKQLSSRTKITKVDDFMKIIFDDFLALANNGIVREILEKVGANHLAQLLDDRHNAQSTEKPVNKQEIVEAMTTAIALLDRYAGQIFREKVSPLIFYIGATGLLPDEMATKAMTVKEISQICPHLQFSSSEEEGTFFIVNDSIITIFAKTEYYSKKIPVDVED
jgi:von Willebrand factor type A domain